MNRLCFIASLLLLSLAAQAGTPDIPDEINAKLARTKSQIATDAKARAASASGVTSIGGAGSSGAAGAALGQGCNIAIGNVFEDNKNKAISTSAKRETTVIVTGDVIQVGNNCR